MSKSFGLEKFDDLFLAFFIWSPNSMTSFDIRIMFLFGGILKCDSYVAIITGKLCIEVTPASKIAFISEELCIGCGICVKVSFLIVVLLGYLYLISLPVTSLGIILLICCFLIEMPL